MFQSLYSQTSTFEIPQSELVHAHNTFNHTYWDENFRNPNVNAYRFINHTEQYAFAVNYDDISFASLQVEAAGSTTAQAFAESRTQTFPVPQNAQIDFAVLQNGSPLYVKSATPTNRNSFSRAPLYTQLPEFGFWCNRRMIDSINFTPTLPNAGRFTGIEWMSWHDRITLSFHLRPQVNIPNAQLQLAVTMPSAYNSHFSSGGLHAFGNGSGEGFVLRAGTSADTALQTGQTFLVNSPLTQLFAGQSYKVSIVFYPLQSSLPTQYMHIEAREQPLQIHSAQTLPDTNGQAVVSYSEAEGIYYVDIPRYTMGQYNCATADLLQNIEFAVENPSATPAIARLCFRQIPAVNVTGFSSMIRNRNGDPSGLPLQISKNWHGAYSRELYGGSRINEYTEIHIPAHTTVHFDYTRVGAKWGTTYGAFSHQLSLVGYNTFAGHSWLEAGLGSFGESVCHSPDYSIGNSNVTDWRPFLVTSTNYGGTSSPCSWTGNLGGIDFAVYVDSSQNRDFQSEAKTEFQSHGPNLSETTIGFLSSDKKLQTEYSFFLNRSDDFNRVYYKVKIKALDQLFFNRLDFFQLGGDSYAYHYAKSIAIGNDTGLVQSFFPTNSGTNDYTTGHIPLTGNQAWLWSGDGELTNQNGYGTINMDGNTGFILRSYQASFGSVSYPTPYLRERSHSRGSRNPTSYCLVPPPGISSLMAGDSVEFTIEAVILPKQASDYYGPNSNFAQALATLGNSWELLFREARGNRIQASSATHSVHNSYPLSIETQQNEVLFTLTGGKGYVPVVFTGLTDIQDPQLWKAEDSCWVRVDQSNWGKDYWQVDFDPASGTYTLIYNVDQDIAQDAEARIRYFLGDSAPMPELSLSSQVNANGWTANQPILVDTGDGLAIAPGLPLQTASGGGWTWQGPHGFTADSSVLIFPAVDSNTYGNYDIQYISPFGCRDTLSFSIVEPGPPLPTEGLEFYLSQGPRSVALFWSTQSESNSSHFILERSTDLHTWTLLSRHPAAGHSERSQTYQSQDVQPQFGLNYYRLGLFDQNGSLQRAPLKWAYYEAAPSRLLAFPDPLLQSHGQLKLSFQAEGGPEQIRIYNAQGQLLRQIAITSRPGDNQIQVDLAQLPAGIYYVYLTQIQAYTHFTIR